MPDRGVHSAVIHATRLAGVEVVDLVSARAFPRHAHDQIGLGVLLSGAQRSWSGRGQVEACAGDVITTNAGEMHDGAPSAGPQRAWRMVYLSPLAASRYLATGAEITQPVIQDAELRRAVLTLIHTATHIEAREVLALEEALARTLALLAARYTAVGETSAGSRGGIARALARLRDDPTAAVSLEELARLEGLGVFQLLRRFERELGITPHAYQTQLRIRLARRLLADGLAPAEVAYAAGFSDQSHLNRVFLRQVGVTPGRYRAAVS